MPVAIAFRPRGCSGIGDAHRLRAPVAVRERTARRRVDLGLRALCSVVIALRVGWLCGAGVAGWVRTCDLIPDVEDTRPSVGPEVLIREVEAGVDDPDD